MGQVRLALDFFFFPLRRGGGRGVTRRDVEDAHTQRVARCSLRMCRCCCAFFLWLCFVLKSAALTLAPLDTRARDRYGMMWYEYPCPDLLLSDGVGVGQGGVQ